MDNAENFRGLLGGRHRDRWVLKRSGAGGWLRPSIEEVLYNPRLANTRGLLHGLANGIRNGPVVPVRVSVFLISGVVNREGRGF